MNFEKRHTQIPPVNPIDQQFRSCHLSFISRINFFYPTNKREEYKYSYLLPLIS
jgi:hypothetical protein